MQTTSVSKRVSYLAIGGVGLALSAVYLGASSQMPFGTMERPGSALFPIFSGFMLALASLATIWEGWRTDASTRVNLPAGANLKRMAQLIGVIVGYLLVLPWLGQFVSSVLFSALLLRLLSDISRLRILVYSVTIAFALHVVFVTLLKVRMPSGVLGI